MAGSPARSALHHGPPRLLLGVALLFWGAMIGHPLIGLLAAIACEATHWTRLRWDFQDGAFVRAWHVCALLILGVGTLVVLDTSLLEAFPGTAVWLPLIFFPLHFVQAYGLRGSMPLTALSGLARRRHAHALRHQLPFRDVRFHFGNFYLCGILLAAGLGEHSRSNLFFAGVVSLATWFFLAQSRAATRRRPTAAVILVLIAGAGGVLGEIGLNRLYRHFVHSGRGGATLAYARQVRTAIGELGEIKQSPQIQWRLRLDPGPIPRLLRVAAYNNYRNSYWDIVLPPDPVPEDFTELDSFGVDPPSRITARLDELDFLPGEDATAPDLSSFQLRGLLENQTLLPLPGSSASLVIPAQNLEINSFGTVRIQPEDPVANATVRWKSGLTTARGPWEHPRDRSKPPPDLAIPDSEQAAIRRVASELQLRQGSLDDKIRTLRNHFFQNFTYTRYLADPAPDTKRERTDFVGIFLEETRRGHCEYFATAAALLLREAGVPTRYATGFAVMEIDPKKREVRLRGTHAHAWCLAWDERSRTWIDVDLTPPTWSDVETPRSPAWQGLQDWLDTTRVDFLVWRSDPANLSLAFAIFLVPVAVGGVWVGRRLWKSRARLETNTPHTTSRPPSAASPLHALEPAAALTLGPRSPAVPLARWLRPLADHLPDPSVLTRALQLHLQLRFDPSASAPALENELQPLVEKLHLDLSQIPSPPST